MNISFPKSHNFSVNIEKGSILGKKKYFMKTKDDFIKTVDDCHDIRHCSVIIPASHHLLLLSSLYLGSMCSHHRRQPFAKEYTAWLKGKTVGVLHFYTSDNKLKPFSCKCDTALDGFPWRSTEWSILNRGKEMELGEAKSVTRLAKERGS